MRLAVALLALAGGFAYVGAARADAPTLMLSFGGEPRSSTSAELLARPDAATLAIPADVAYGRPMTFRAVPLLALIPASANPALDTVEARASDGFVSQLPRALVEKGAAGGSVAWIAVEDGSAPWPNLPDKHVSAGPFYLVWEHPERSGVGSEQWPYQIAALTGVESPAHRWPQMAVDASLPADAPARRGQEVFTVQCMPCHRMKGAGVGELGPDLGQPMSPVQYFTAEGLRKLIRNPKSVRTWPGQIMPAFDAEKLPDADLDAVIAYLGAMAAVPAR
jgi:mono/diheme cytochrome c family protein